MFRKAYPDRHFDCGIAEADMMGAAAGAAAMGMTPFVSSFAMFAAGRAFEQVRNSIGYPHLNVKIGATHGGLSVGEDGASHQCCEDFALMRSIPGMVVMCPADEVEARAAVKAAYDHHGPVYLRFGRLAVPVIHREGYPFRIGKGEVLRDGTDVAILATGLMVAEALQAAEALAAQGVLRPGDQPVHHQAPGRGAGAPGRQGVRQDRHLRGAQHHRRPGGGGCAPCWPSGAPPLCAGSGVNDEFGCSGPGGDLLKKFGLSAAHVEEVVLDFLAAGKKAE